MTSTQDDTPRVISSDIWSRLTFGVVRKRKNISRNDSEQSKLSAVERQTEYSRKGGTIWEAVRKADEAAFQRLVNTDQSNVDARGPVGECPIHMLFLYGTETHLQMARYLIKHFPRTITQIYNQPVSFKISFDININFSFP
jgi:hypothetical protein